MTAAPQNGDFKIRIAQGVQTAAPLGRLPLFYHIISKTGNRTIDIQGRYLKVLFIKKESAAPSLSLKKEMIISMTG